MDIKKGDFFTVKKWVSSNDRSYKGECLEAKIIDFPFVRAIRHHGYAKGMTITLDLTEVEIMPLSAEFIEDVMNGGDE